MLLKSNPARLALAALLLVLALLTLFVGAVHDRAGTAFLVLLSAALVLVLVPWDRLQALSVGGVSVTLETPQLKGAIAATLLDRVKNERLYAWLQSVADLVQTVQGARVLWIDDHPDVILGERRILRALGVEVVMARSSEEAVRQLAGDGDFDLVITDVLREGGTSFTLSGGEPLHEGTNFIVALREAAIAELTSVRAIKDIPVVFYAAYDHARLMRFTARARELPPGADATNAVEALVETAVIYLARARREPIETPPKKIPT